MTERTLQKSDSILEPQVVDAINQFLEGGGDAPQAVTFLSESYVGLPVMCNLMNQWIELCGIPSSETVASSHSFFANYLRKHFESKKIDRIFDEMKKEPRWFAELMQEPEWRQLIYTLSDEQKHCLFLTFALNRIAEMGMLSEIAHLPRAATHFPVLKDILSFSLQQIMEAADIETARQRTQALIRVVTSSEISFAYAVLCLLPLMQAERQAAFRLSDGRFTAFCEEMEAHCVLSGHMVARKLLMELYRPPISFNDPNYAAYTAHFSLVSSSVQYMLNSKSLNPSDMKKIRNTFSMEVLSFVAPLLESSAFVQLLWEDCFQPRPGGIPSHIEDTVFVLCAISCRRYHSMEASEAELELRRCCGTVVAFCAKNIFGKQLGEKMKMLREAAVHAVIARGLLHWVRCNTLQGSVNMQHALLSSPVYLPLVQLISERHSSHRNASLTLLHDIYVSSGLENVDVVHQLLIKERLLLLMVDILCAGEVAGTIAVLTSMAPTMDSAMIRFVVSNLFQSIEGPYSPEFVKCMVPWLSLEVCLQALARTEELAPVLAFVKEAHSEGGGEEGSNSAELAELEARMEALQPKKRRLGG
mgnify:CR=1 FL=1